MKEIWKQIKGYEGIYSISNFGRVRRDKEAYSTFAGRILRPHSSQRYGKVFLHKDGKQKLFKIHQLVAYAFIGKCPPGKEINHKDGNPRNNHVDNLEYVTHSENMLHAFRVIKSNHTRGENHARAKLKESDVIEIRKLYETGKYIYKDLAKLYNVSDVTIGFIIRRQTWRHI